MMITSSDTSRTSFSRMMRSFERPASTEITRLPAFLSAAAMGNIGATPTPPPAQTTVPKFSICVAWPRGPTTSVMQSPSLRSHRRLELKPTFWITRVMIPFSVSACAMVNGMRSPFSPTLTMTKLPALYAFAISGASTRRRKTFSENCSFDTILYIILLWSIKMIQGRGVPPLSFYFKVIPRNAEDAFLINL